MYTKGTNKNERDEIREGSREWDGLYAQNIATYYL